MNPTNTFSIFLGDAKTLYLQLWNPNVPENFNVVNIPNAFGLQPVDLTSCTQIVVNLPNADGTITQLKLSSSQVAITSPGVLGQFSCPISSVVSALLNVGVYQNLVVTYTIGSVVSSMSFPGALSVFQVS